MPWPGTTPARLASSWAWLVWPAAFSWSTSCWIVASGGSWLPTAPAKIRLVAAPRILGPRMAKNTLPTASASTTRTFDPSGRSSPSRRRNDALKFLDLAAGVVSPPMNPGPPPGPPIGRLGPEPPGPSGPGTTLPTARTIGGWPLLVGPLPAVPPLPRLLLSPVLPPFVGPLMRPPPRSPGTGRSRGRCRRSASAPRGCRCRRSRPRRGRRSGPRGGSSPRAARR